MTIIEEEEGLILRLQAFDMSAIESVFDQYNEAIYRYGYRLLGSQDKAEECVAETFSRFLHALKNGKGPKKYVRPYLYRMAHNWITDQYRRAIPEDEGLPENHASQNDHPEDIVIDNIESQEIRNVLRALPENQRQAVVLKFLEGLENQEIAIAMNKPVGAVKALQHRGLQTIRKKIRGEAMNKLEDEIKQKLEKLDAIPERNPLRVQSAKKNFLSEMHQLAGETTVSVPTKSWWNQLNIKKETFSMKLITIATILSLLLGGGITAVAAQDSLPGDLLYPVKTLVEDIELGLATDPETEFDIALNHAFKRFEEIQILLDEGEVVGEAHLLAWQEAFQRALQYGVNTEDPIGKLLMVQQQLKYQEEMMNKGKQTGVPFQNQFERMMNYQAGLVDASIENPELLASELEFMANYSNQYGEEKLENAWMNMYMFGALDTEGTIGEVQNQGEIQHPIEDPFMWMHLLGNRLSEIEPGGIDQGGTTGGFQNSYNDQPNGGNQGDNGNGNNGGSGGNEGGNGGK
jgi:RNA polymerase sigma-70 factor (ECF subfamily)